MRHYLLTGAGFSANWGGWVASEAFEYLLGCPEILADDRLRDLLWECQLKGGFEDALAQDLKYIAISLEAVNEFAKDAVAGMRKLFPDIEPLDVAFENAIRHRLQKKHEKAKDAPPSDDER